MHPTLVNIGAYIKANNLNLPPVAQAASATRQGAAGIDVTAFKSAVLVGFTGANTGAPSAVNVTYSLESRVPAGAWAPVLDRDGNPLQVVLTAANACGEVDVDLTLIGDDHEEVRIKEVTTLTGGTSPTQLTGALLVLGGANRRPI